VRSPCNRPETAERPASSNIRGLICVPQKNILHFNIQLLCDKIVLFLYFQLLYEHEEAAGLDSVVDGECRTESTPER